MSSCGAHRLAIVGAGWAGLAAAVRAAQAGWSVSVFEMAATAGGRARSVEGAGPEPIDNGQHILIGAYTRTLALMQELGVDPQAALLRLPLTLTFADGHGLALTRTGRAPLAAAAALWRATWATRGWTFSDRLSLWRHACTWAAQGFVCADSLSVAALCAHLAPAVRRDLIDPLCVSALNTASERASARVLLRVLRDALLSSAGSSDLLLPRLPLQALLPGPAWQWLAARGASLHLQHRVQALHRAGAGWALDEQAAQFDAVLLCCSAPEAARLAKHHAPAWAAQASALPFAPILSVHVRAPGLRLPQALLALREGPQAPAQFVFDHGQLGGDAGHLVAVISGAEPWVQAGREAAGQAVLAQLSQQLAPLGWPAGAQVLRVWAEKRATFSCLPGLNRPPAAVAPGLLAAADFVEGPYPATLEGAVRAAEAAVSLCKAAFHDAELRREDRSPTNP
jgi:hydroxysqualene dehydroxylase